MKGCCNHFLFEELDDRDRICWAMSEDVADIPAFYIAEQQMSLQWLLHLLDYQDMGHASLLIIQLTSDNTKAQAEEVEGRERHHWSDIRLE